MANLAENTRPAIFEAVDSYLNSIGHPKNRPSSEKSRSNMVLARLEILTYLLLKRADGQNTWNTFVAAQCSLN
jgi:hypothetical protein